MLMAEYVVNELIKYGVTDAFGVPGGVILRFLYAMKEREPELVPHLSYHEQMAGFAACGYSQASGKLGVAYATRGPGFTNMITCIAEAFQESLPVLFITAHGSRPNRGMRFENNQEIDAVGMVSSITKYAVNVESVDEVSEVLRKAYFYAMNGRKGPVLLDFAASLWTKEIETMECNKEQTTDKNSDIEYILDIIKKQLEGSKRPVILIGDGIRHAIDKEKIYDIVERLKIPVISSRGAQDILSGSSFYFGYIGSHGVRYSNFILSKADLIIAIGNRLAFPIESESFAPIVKNTHLIRIDVDEKEFIRVIPDSDDFLIDARDILSLLDEKKYELDRNSDWYKICILIKDLLEDCDVAEPVKQLEKCVLNECSEVIYVCDIGNNEFWFARAFEKAGKPGTVLYSKAYGTLGSGLGRAIGAYYASGRMVYCIIGDQGFQYNIQELIYIKQWKLPIKVILLNNCISGMITDHEKSMFGEKFVHVSSDTGYMTPNFSEIIKGYGIRYTTDERVARKSNEPLVYEIKIDSNISLTPNLPKGNACQDMEPKIEHDLYEMINQL